MKYSRSSYYSIAIHDDAQADLDLIWDENEDAAADIEAFLEEAKLNQGTLENLTVNGYVHYDDPSYDVKEWNEAKKLRYNLWRVRLLWLQGAASKYRIVYAFHPSEFRYYVLGIVDRGFKYDIKRPISKRITAAYDALNIPPLLRFSLVLALSRRPTEAQASLRSKLESFMPRYPLDMQRLTVS